MPRRLVQSLSGLGSIHAGDLLLRTTHYQLSLYSDKTSDGDNQPDGVTSIEGHIDITGIQEAVVLAGPGTLTLTIEDGRRLRFHVTSSGGDIHAQGWVT
jgi:hypothetical protein